MVVGGPEDANKILATFTHMLLDSEDHLGNLVMLLLSGIQLFSDLDFVAGTNALGWCFFGRNSYLSPLGELCGSNDAEPFALLSSLRTSDNDSDLPGELNQTGTMTHLF